MSDPSHVFLLSLLIIVIGVLLKRSNIFHEGDGKTLSRIVLNFTFPALIITEVRKMRLDSSVFYIPLICFGFCILLILIAYLLFQYKPRKDKGIILMAMGGFNVGLFAFPLVEGIWGANGLQYIAMFDIGNAIIILGIGYFIGDYYSPLNSLRERTDFKYLLGLFFKSIPFVSYFIALVLNYYSIRLPFLFEALFETVSRANMPLVLVLLGFYFNFHLKKNHVFTIFKVIAIRYILGLLIGLILFYTLPFNLMYRTILLVGLTLPIGLTIIPFSDKFGYDTGFAASAANMSTVISFIIMWFIVAFVGSS